MQNNMKNRIAIHKDFTLNGCKYTNIEALLTVSKSISNDAFLFLNDWFNTADFIKVKTSGSTGKPKRVQLKKSAMIESAKATGTYFGLPEKTSALLCLSPSYIAGKMMLVRALVLGWHLDIENSSAHPLDGIKNSYDFCAMVPMQVQNSLAQLHQIKMLIIGGAPVSFNLKEALKNLETSCFETYGMTETITHIAVKPLNLSAQKWRKNTVKNCFEILPNINISIDYRGCLVVEAPKICEELILTNDLVKLIDTTHFEWIGRFDCVINSGGVKINPELIEEKLAKYISCRFFIAGIKDDYLTQKVVLVCEGKNQDFSHIPFGEILKKYEQPKEIIYIKKFIETATQKINRNKTLNLLE